MYRLSSRTVAFAVFITTMMNTTLSQISPHGKIKNPCTDCHSTESWKELLTPLKFNHTSTGFALQGMHANVSCMQCHSNKKFIGTPTECFSCHQSDFASALAPNHQVGKFSHDCLSCHTYSGWRPSIFQHSKTNFQLTGAHLSVDCASCHTNNRFAGLSGECFSCHQNDYAKVTTPNHLTAQFSHDCLTCHAMNGWIPSTFDHAKTNFQLVGAHTAAECSSCHTNGRFKGVPTECFPCHQVQYANVVIPNHVTAQFSQNCTDCHSVISWKPSTFDHSKTAFQLTGAHVSGECSSCHKGGQFKGTASDCYSCHQQDFVSAAAPNHALSQFSHDCVSCHNTMAWKPSTFNHSTTNFPLTGAHVTTDCLFCHKNGQFKGTASDCYSCHQTDFANVSDPNHVSGSFDHNCLSCHTTSAWSPATFDHNKTDFALTGAHLTAACQSCHAGGKFSGTSTDCFVCHQQDYTSSVNPPHATAHYPTTCTTCHTTTAWKPSTFDHNPFFPISSGSKHRPGRWTTCADCHTNSSNFTVFSCITCHEHNKTSMDDKHKEQPGYVYESSACYRCHPRGES